MYPSTASGLKTASAQITTRPSLLHSVFVSPPSASGATIIVYDSEDSNLSGKTVLLHIHLDTADQTVTGHLTNPVVANRGIYIDATGTGYSYVAHFSLM